MILAVIGSAILAGCSSNATTSGAKSTTPSSAVKTAKPGVPTTTTTTFSTSGADAQGARVFNVLFGFKLGTLAQQLAVVQNSKSIGAAVTKELSALSKDGAIGAAVLSVKVATPKVCSDQGLKSPCVVATYNVLGPKSTITSNQVGYAVLDQGNWYVSQSSACRISPPGATKPSTKSNC